MDYFATSLPTMLVLPDDLAARARVEATVLAAQADAGLGERDLARARLTAALVEDPSHPAATDLLHDLDDGPAW